MKEPTEQEIKEANEFSERLVKHTPDSLVEQLEQFSEVKRVTFAAFLSVLVDKAQFETRLAPVLGQVISEALPDIDVSLALNVTPLMSEIQNFASNFWFTGFLTGMDYALEHGNARGG